MAEDLLDQLENPEEGLRAAKLGQIVAQLRAIAESDPREMFSDDGMMISPSRWPDALANAVSSVAPHHAGGYQVKFHDKMRAATLLAQYENLLEEGTAAATPLDAQFDRLPREMLLSMKKGLDELAEAAAKAQQAQEPADASS